MAMDAAIVIGGSLVIVALIFVFVFAIKSRAEEVAAAAAETRRCTIRDAKHGERVRIVGVAKAIGEPSLSPYTGTACVAWCTSGYGRTSGDRGGARNLPSRQDVEPFLIEDETGGIAVGTSHVQLDLLPTSVDADGPTKHPFGSGILQREAGGPVSFYEGVIPQGGQVAVTGIVQRDPDGSVRIVGDAANPAVISNLPTMLEG